jgi:hypothetical protein
VGGAGGTRRSDRRPAQTIRKVLDAGLAELRESSYASLTRRAVPTRARSLPGQLDEAVNLILGGSVA